MVLAAVTYLVTRRTSQRFFRFPPGDPVVKQIFEYALAYAAGETGVRVHAWILMSNHFHIVATDVRGQAPLFYQLLDQTIANLLKRHFPDLEGELWNKSQTSAVDLSNELSPSDVTVLEKLVYTMGNAKTSGLVSKWTQWEGTMSKPEDMGQRVVREATGLCVGAHVVARARRDEGARAAEPRALDAAGADGDVAWRAQADPPTEESDRHEADSGARDLGAAEDVGKEERHQSAHRRTH